MEYGKVNSTNGEAKRADEKERHLTRRNVEWSEAYMPRDRNGSGTDTQTRQSATVSIHSILWVKVNAHTELAHSTTHMATA